MNGKLILTLIGGLLAIFGGEILKQNVQQWKAILDVQFIGGILVQIAGLITVIISMLYTDKPKE
jgi:hypothetical protein